MRHFLAQAQTGKQEAQRPGKEGRSQAGTAEGGLIQQPPASSGTNYSARLGKTAGKAGGDVGRIRTCPRGHVGILAKDKASSDFSPRN